MRKKNNRGLFLTLLSLIIILHAQIAVHAMKKSMDSGEDEEWERLLRPYPSFMCGYVAPPDQNSENFRFMQKLERERQELMITPYKRSNQRRLQRLEAERQEAIQRMIELNDFKG